MSLRQKKVIFFVFYLAIILSVPITIVNINFFSSAVFSDSDTWLSVFQRLTGLLSFILIFIQIILGSQMSFWIKFIGSTAFKLHTTQGIIAYLLILIHPLFENVIVYKISGSIVDSLLVFLPKFYSSRDVLIAFGKVGFLLSTIAVVSAYFREKPFFRKNWRALHFLNYLIFYAVSIHARIGTDFNTFPFKFVYLSSLVIVTLLLINRIFSLNFLKIVVLELVLKKSDKSYKRL